MTNFMIQVAPHKNDDSIIIFVSTSFSENSIKHDNEKKGKTLEKSIFVKIK